MTAPKVKRSYRKSSPIGRLRRNAYQVRRQASLLQARVAAWGSSDDVVASVEAAAAKIVELVGVADGRLAALERSGFAPPEKPRVLTWEEGQRVAVARKFRGKYELAFCDILERDPDFLDALVVESVLPSGEISVRRKGRSPFLVPKTHLVEVEGGVGWLGRTRAG